MAPSFFEQHWFDLLQSGFLAGGFLFAAISCHQEAKARRIGHLLSLQESRRDVWAPLMNDPGRVLESSPDLSSAPVTAREAMVIKRAERPAPSSVPKVVLYES